MYVQPNWCDKGTLSTVLPLGFSLCISSYICIFWVIYESVFGWLRKKANYTLCSRNFQNVKLRLDFVEIWSFYLHSDFTWNPILANSNGPKILILTILKGLNFYFSKFELLSRPKFTKNSKFRVLNCQKWHFWTVGIHQNLISRKIWVVVNRSNFNKVKP